MILHRGKVKKEAVGHLKRVKMTSIGFNMGNVVGGVSIYMIHGG